MLKNWTKIPSILNTPTLNNAVAKGIWTASGTWTIPAVTLGGAVSGGGQNINAIGNLQLNSTGTLVCAADNGYIQIFGGTDLNAARIVLFGKSFAGTPGQLSFYTPDAGLTASERLKFSGGVATSVATWANVTQTGLNITSGQVLQVAGTQVVGARVVDARCDDVVDATYGAEEAGVLDALRDAMISHGLISAS